jgi:hypothetical protein
MGSKGTGGRIFEENGCSGESVAGAAPGDAPARDAGAFAARLAGGTSGGTPRNARILTPPTWRERIARSRGDVRPACRPMPRLPAMLLAAVVVAGCATVQEPPPAPAKPVPRNVEPPPPPVNLSGFPLAYRQGFADGCASANSSERKDAGRLSDGNYRTGWQDGLAQCRKKK